MESTAEARPTAGKARRLIATLADAAVVEVTMVEPTVVKLTVCCGT